MIARYTSLSKMYSTVLKKNLNILRILYCHACFDFGGATLPLLRIYFCETFSDPKRPYADTIFYLMMVSGGLTDFWLGIE